MIFPGCISPFFKILLAIIVIILAIIAIYLSEEIWVQYISKDTSFSESETKVTRTDSPTFVFGFWPLKKTNYSEEIPYMAYEQLELGKDFEVSFGIKAEGEKIVETINLTE